MLLGKKGGGDEKVGEEEEEEEQDGWMDVAIETDWSEELPEEEETKQTYKSRLSTVLWLLAKCSRLE